MLGLAVNVDQARADFAQHRQRDAAAIDAAHVAPVGTQLAGQRQALWLRRFVQALLLQQWAQLRLELACKQKIPLNYGGITTAADQRAIRTPAQQQAHRINDD